MLGEGQAGEGEHSQGESLACGVRAGRAERVTVRQPALPPSPCELAIVSLSWVQAAAGGVSVKELRE